MELQLKAAGVNFVDTIVFEKNFVTQLFHSKWRKFHVDVFGRKVSQPGSEGQNFFGLIWLKSGIFLFSRLHATLHLALSVGRSVRGSVTFLNVFKTKEL